jgi:hypothetical protein
MPEQFGRAKGGLAALDARVLASGCGAGELGDEAANALLEQPMSFRHLRREHCC